MSKKAQRTAARKPERPATLDTVFPKPLAPESPEPPAIERRMQIDLEVKPVVVVGYRRRYVAVNSLSPTQADGLAALVRALKDRGEVFHTRRGHARQVGTPADAVRWLLEQAGRPLA